MAAHEDTRTRRRVGQADHLSRRRAESAADHRSRRPAGRPGPGRGLVVRGLPRRRPGTRSQRPQRLRRRAADQSRRVPRAGRRWRTSTWTPNPRSGNRSPRWPPGGFLTEARNVVLLGPPGTGKTHLATALGIVAARHGHRVLFATATDWVTRLTDAHRAGRLPQELARLRRYGLIIVDEVGYLPFEQDAANLFFQLVSSRYEHASLILTSQPAVQRLGRRLRRPSRRRRDDRPHRPPRRRPHPQRRQLPAPRTRHRQPPQHPHHHRRNRVLDCPQPFTFQAPKPPRIRAPSTGSLLLLPRHPHLQPMQIVAAAGRKNSQAGAARLGSRPPKLRQDVQHGLSHHG